MDIYVCRSYHFLFVSIEMLQFAIIFFGICRITLWTTVLIQNLNINNHIYKKNGFIQLLTYVRRHDSLL